MDAALFQKIKTAALEYLRDIRLFSKLVVRRELHRYQLEVARAIVDSVIFRRGLEFAVMFPRQSGKNETQAQVEAYLLNVFRRVNGAQIVKASPTQKPQSFNALTRLESALDNDWSKGQWGRVQGYIVQLGKAQVVFFSAEPQANVVGASATLLLECDEAQDVIEAEWEKKFVPMAASTNATTVYWGTAWTSRTLLARTLKQLQALEAQDGVKRVFIVTPAQVEIENPAYGEHVRKQVAKKGRNHPLIRTQYFNETIDADGGMFPPARRALMVGSHPRQAQPKAGAIYAFLLDVGGEDEGATGDRPLLDTLTNTERDSTSLTIVEVDLSTLADEVINAPTYKAVERYLWIGVKHTMLYAVLRMHTLTWRPRYFVADATGVGAGLYSFLDKALPGIVIPFIFNGATKSKLGWDFLSIVETGRWKDWATPDVGAVPRDGPAPDVEGQIFWKELQHVQYEAGHNQMLKWGVPDNTRDPDTGELIHDDTVLSAALSAVLDEQEWAIGLPSTIIQAKDPLQGQDRDF